MRAFIVAAGIGLLLMAPAGAQDLNTLNRHLEHQQWQRSQDHQNRARSQRPGPRSGENRTVRPRCSADALPPAERRRLEIEYARRARAEGRASADLWIRGEGQRFRRDLEARGLC